jgi:nicotinate-nucleotide adenylyltransferase
VSSRDGRRVGVFGGSFNPIHYGHLLLADEIVEILGLDCLVFVPAAEPPHKLGGDLAPARARFEMTALAVRGHSRFHVSDVEIRRQGPSYTVDTLAELESEGDLHLVIGSETFLDLLSWREPGEVARRARLVVVRRAGSEFDPEGPAAQKVLDALSLPAFARAGAGETVPAGCAPLLAAAASLPISASDLRLRVRHGRSLAYRLPDRVIDYIREHRLYQGGRC